MAAATATATPTVAKLKIKSPANFVAFLKRFVDIADNILLEIHQDALKAKNFTADRSVVKYSKMPMIDVLEGNVPVDFIRVGVHNIKRLIKVFDHFPESDEIFLEVKFETVSDTYICSQLLFKSESLKIKILTGDTNVGYNYISPDMLKRLIDSVTSEKVLDFPFPKDAFQRVASLCSMDKDDDFLTLAIADGNVNVKSKSFDYVVGDAPAGATVDFTFYNEHFGLIEPEVSTFVVGHNRMIVKSQESDTMLIVGRIE